MRVPIHTQGTSPLSPGRLVQVYVVKETRMNGDGVRLLNSYPQGWQVNVATSRSDSKVILQQKEKPGYQQIDELLRKLPWTMSSKGLLDRMQAEIEFNQRSLEQGAPPKE
jgi:hypothetical protein